MSGAAQTVAPRPSPTASGDFAARAGVPQVKLADMWRARCSALELVGPAQRRKQRVIVVGSGLAGAAAAASLSELGYPVTCLCFQDSPRRAHSVAAQGGINAAKDYQNDGGTGSAPEANTVPVPKRAAERALDAAACIGCGACVAACPNGSAALFVGAKLAHLAALPQGRIERERRALAMVRAADAEGFGGCSFPGECQAACPKGIGLDVIAGLSREWLRAKATDAA